MIPASIISWAYRAIDSTDNPHSHACVK